MKQSNSHRMYKVREYLLSLVILTVIIIVLPATVNAGIPLNSKPLTLTMVADTTSGLGHSFLVVRNNTGEDVYIGEYRLPSGEQASLGLRGGAPWVEGFGGSYINIEAANKDAYKDFAYVTCEINQKKLDKIVKYFKKSSKYEVDASIIIHNCTTFASVAWNKVCPVLDKVVPDNLPADLKLQIKLLSKSKTGKSLTGCGILKEVKDYTNVFYMNKSGKLIPYSIGEKIKTSSADIYTTATQAKITWAAAKGKTNKHTVKSTKYGAGYVIEYKTGSGKNYTRRYKASLSTNNYTITGLKAGKKYVVKVFPAYKYNANGKTAYSLGTGIQAEFTTNKVTLKKKTLNMTEGDSAVLKTTLKGTTTDHPIVWRSSDPAVASVSSSGTVKAVGKGTAVISVSYGGSTAKCTVTVSKNIPKDAEVFNGHSYKRFEDGLTWTKAKEACENAGGHLVTITSQGEQDFITQMIQQGSKNAYWLGGRTPNRTGSWITGEDFIYSNWAQRQPDAYRNAESYMQIYNAYNPRSSNEIGQWNDITEDNTIPGEEDFFKLEYCGYICEWDDVR